MVSAQRSVYGTVRTGTTRSEQCLHGKCPMVESVEMTDVRDNAVLAVLPDDELANVVGRGRLQDVEGRAAVYESGALIDHVQFPITAVFSFVVVVDGEPAVEVGTIGREGMVGLPLFLGTTTSPNAAFCQVPGRTLRLDADDFRELLTADGTLQRQLYRFVQATMVQLAQNVACNRLHATRQRASRWLLMTEDRVASPKFPLTHEFLGQMLGVRRATVSEAASSLQADGLIRYARGVVEIVDRPGLEAAACPCYDAIRRAFDTLRAPEM
jgi:CRP-like cAMP-binding protein